MIAKNRLDWDARIKRQLFDAPYIRSLRASKGYSTAVERSSLAQSAITEILDVLASQGVSRRDQNSEVADLVTYCGYFVRLALTYEMMVGVLGRCL